MTYRGRVKNGVIVTEPPVELPEGMEVVISPSEDESLPTWGEVLKDCTGKGEGLPPDLARNHDHYIHGAPKRDEGPREDETHPTWAEVFKDIIGKIDGPTDASINHDHYLYGTPKKQ